MGETWTAETAVPAAPRPSLDEKERARLLAASELYLTAKSRAAAAEAAVRQGRSDERTVRRLQLLQLRLEIARRDYDATLAALGFTARQPS